MPQLQEQGCRPRIQNADAQQKEQQQDLDDSSLHRAAAALMSIDQCEMDDPQFVGAPVSTVATDADLARKKDVTTAGVAVRNDARAVDMRTVKRKRGRPPRNQGKAGPPPPPSSPPQRNKKDEEDVCFICFDGGSLVLCDRRGCPKAYHPACIKRDEAFFRSKAKWNCGWHICSSCRKASSYMCYSCTYSLCKGCTKDADYVCVRGNKGFCGTCMRTVFLIENIEIRNKEMIQVDFDDKTSWEYLFKVYWVYLKAKLSLSLDELIKAKNPWKGEELPKAKSFWKGAVALPPRGESLCELHHGTAEKASCSGNCSANFEANQSKRRKNQDQPKFLNEGNSLVMEKSFVDDITSLHGGTTWATKELLEFVAHMRDGDVSVLSQFDVQGLLLEYIKRNNLQDPQQKCQIVCDSRLINLFGKARVGHFEMLKLLEYHFLMKEKSPVDCSLRVGVIAAIDAGGNNDGQLMMANDRRPKTCKKIDGRGVLQINTNPSEYAAIDVHNVDLLYLKRSLVENLMDDAEKFNEKVVGSFVRIRIAGGDQKQDIYRLVQVVGTCKVAESYKAGTRTTNTMLEILNLDKKEVISIDGISNLEFLEEECKRLRQCVKRGLIKRLTVGEIQNKAMALQAVKVADLEEEVLRLNHLRDRASEQGCRKELREYVEKLELLKSPRECQRRLLDIRNIHTDPHMDPRYESDEDAGEPDNKQGGIGPGNSREGAEANSTLSGADVVTDTGNWSQKNVATNCEQSRNTSATFFVDRDGTTQILERVSESTLSLGGEALGQNNGDTLKNWIACTSSVTGEQPSEPMARPESFSGVALPVLSVNDIEMERLWHYQDPTGKTQGPFSLMQLRKWSTAWLFPRELRVWRINEKQDDSILLTEALAGRFEKEMQSPSLPLSSYLQRQEVTMASRDTNKRLECLLEQSRDKSHLESKNTDHSVKLVQNDASVHCNGNDEHVRCNGWGSRSSSWTTVIDVAADNDDQAQSSLQGRDLGSNSLSDQPQVCNSLPSPSISGKIGITAFLQVREGQGDEQLSSHLSNVTGSSAKTTRDQTTIGESDEKRANSEGHSNQSSGQNWRLPSVKDSAGGWDCKSGFVSTKSIETSDQNKEIDFSDLLSPTSKLNIEDFKGQAADNKLSVSSNAPALDSGCTLSTASSLVVGGAQLPEVAVEWRGYSSTPAKPSVQESDSNLESAPALRTTLVAGDHALTPTSESVQLAHSPPTHPVIDACSWHPIISEPAEFCSLVDESVSDLLAEVEAMESFGHLPSPTSKITCGDELAHSSDNDCFSPVEGFCPTPDPGKSDALSSTGDVQISSRPTLVDEPLQLCPLPSKPTVTDEPLTTSQMPSQLTVTNELLTSHTRPSTFKG